MKKREETIAKIAPHKKEYQDKAAKLSESKYNAKVIPKEVYMKADKEVLRKKIMANNSSCKNAKLVKVIFIDLD